MYSKGMGSFLCSGGTTYIGIENYNKATADSGLSDRMDE
jgi:hypothetical protein